MTDTIRGLWATVATFPCDVGPTEYADIDAQRAVLGRLVDAYQDAGDEARGLFLARLLARPATNMASYNFHLWRDVDDPGPRCWQAMGIDPPNFTSEDRLRAVRWLDSPEACFERLFEKFAADL